VSNLARK